MIRGILLANSRAQALGTLQAQGLTEKDFVVVTDPLTLAGRGTPENPINLRRIGTAFSPEKELELARLVSSGQFLLFYGL